jgi:hypothetical protein
MVLCFDSTCAPLWHSSGVAQLAWRGATSSNGSYVFAMRVDAARERDMLVHCLSQCIFERETGRPVASASPEELSQYCADSIASAASSSASPTKAKASAVLPSSRRVTLPSPPIAPAAGATLVGEFNADLYCYDEQSAAYVIVENDVRVTLSARKFAHELVLVDAQNQLVWAQALTDEMHHHYSSVQCAFTWLFVDGSRMLTLSLRFDRIDGAAGARSATRSRAACGRRSSKRRSPASKRTSSSGFSTPTATSSPTCRPTTASPTTT